VVLVCFRVFSTDCLERAWLTFPPFVRWLSARTLGSSATDDPGGYYHRDYPLMHFDATFERLALKLCRLSDEGPGRLKRALSKNASPELFAPSALQIEAPLFSLPRLRERSEHVAMCPEGATRRVWLPSRWCQPSSTPGSLFQLPTLLGFTLQSFSPLQ
jgi:hypothetical protein